MMMKFLRHLLLLVLLGSLSMVVFAQKKGYDIRVVFAPNDALHQVGDDVMCYLTGYYGADVCVVDSAKLHQNAVRFKRKKLLPDGYYTLSVASTTLPLVIEESRKFSITPAEITNSAENRTYQLFQQQKANTTDTASLRLFCQSLVEANPLALVSRYLQLETQGIFSGNVTDARLLRHPEFHRLVSQELLSVDTQRIDNVMDTYNPNSEIGNYYLKLLMKYYNMDNNAAFDDVLVHLYDKYYQPLGLQLYGDSYERILQRAVKRKRNTLIGAQVPYLEAITTGGARVSTQNPARTYTIIWFWDPDCEDCQEETPKLHTLYLNEGETYQFDVFAHSITDDVERWKTFCTDHALTWTNTCSGLGDTNYDFVDYFNLVTTPACFLIDQNHKIIMRQFSLEEVEIFLQNSYQNR